MKIGKVAKMISEANNLHASTTGTTFLTTGIIVAFTILIVIIVTLAIFIHFMHKKSYWDWRFPENTEEQKNEANNL